MVEKQQDNDHAEVVVRPPFIYAIAMLVAAGLHYYDPWPMAGGEVMEYVGGVILLLGVGLIVLSVRLFIVRKQNPDPLEPTGEIYQDGLYAFSRNPMYVGFTLFVAGLALTLDNVWMLLSVFPLVIAMTYGVIRQEEAYLERCFGEDYRVYKARVRRWI